VNAAYFRAWRKANPEYRAREAERSRRRRLAGGRGDRTAEFARQRVRRAEQRRHRAGDNGWTEQAHPILDAAHTVALVHVRPDRRSLLTRPTYEDAVSEAAVALVAGTDPDEAVRGYLRADRSWLMHTAPLLDAHLEVAA
jgi:hypothetical protein